MMPYRNEPPVDFSSDVNRASMQSELAKVREQLGRTYPLVIGGERVETDVKSSSLNPANHKEVIGYVSQASRAHIDQAIDAAARTFATWRYTSAEQRAGYLFKAAAELRRRKLEFAAWQILEVGKNWAEADGDIAEAIDFLEFYGRQMLRMAHPEPLVPYPGEMNREIFMPLGVGVVIPPWNFPLAILTGMTTSAIVAGNTVLLKPSPNSSVTGYKFMELMQSVGLPDGVINFVPGAPEEIGDYMVGHPRTTFVSFTGSKAVGLHIAEHAGKQVTGQIGIKRVIAEMGGKDGIIVDARADLDAAATAIVLSAFGFQGQKCSAGSRAIIHKDVYDEVVGKVLEQAKQLQMGPPEQNFAVGPVIEKKQFDKIVRYIEIGKSEARLVLGGGADDSTGYYIEPTIFIDADPHSRIMQEEIFGPVLAVCKADSFEHAVDIFNDTEYGLTGSVFSVDRAHLAYAAERIDCGNLYFNRKCTGSLVGVHPFGGFKMSGTDAKAGGQGYLRHFVVSKIVVERF
ncbi:MAG: L-glutamate gamma-semialdehyde dehydrogenase [Alicyclobacillus mali]|uniref:L-glutamate gamma-semialdehyde dehydrogenase n=1 Tax=Alicyclobacillus mali (ex Roth et al. 2021) TaxID=1123961 RepID=UPI0023F55343|nr:L-glutamate gamma-semialdehyde dehydrogenase [Alicyclobacillus mali (ex Roth et al. 2021)]MCL6487371.1 L-glutamate gamma-semialdehyde dehydrogenase [Alicyclobacillus mali (ex Roth et al. 2021)]